MNKNFVSILKQTGAAVDVYIHYETNIIISWFNDGEWLQVSLLMVFWVIEVPELCENSPLVVANLSARHEPNRGKVCAKPY